ncbi:MAG TPA: glycosyltransferase family 2 protein [Bacteroidia bacterium]|nr:glycosyltransferase family 2 protein [Bacteroidia bacterium]
MDVSISIVNYNSSDLVIKAIESINKFTINLNIEFILSNNSIGDIEFNEIKNKFPQNLIKLISFNDNVGFAKANNVAFKEAAGKYFLVYNPDLFLVENSINVCFEFLEKYKDYAACTVKFNYPDGKLQASAFYKQKGASLFYNSIPYISLFIKNKQRIHPSNNPDIVDVDVICGAFTFIRSAIYKQINGFDEDFFLYGEDWEISSRIRALGKIALINNTTVIHIHGGASVREFKDESSELNLFSRKGTQMFVSILLWQKKEFGNWTCFKLYFLLVFGLFLSIFGLFKNKFQKKKLYDWIRYSRNILTISKLTPLILMGRKKIFKTM